MPIPMIETDGNGYAVTLFDASRFSTRTRAAFFEQMLGTAKANAAMVAVNWRLAPPEVAYIVNDAKAKVLFVGAPFYALIDQIKHELKSVTKIVAIHRGRPDWEGYEPWRDRRAAQDPKVPSGDGDVCLQMYTSGTTGLPKGVMLTNQNFLDPSAALISDDRRTGRSDRCLRDRGVRVA